MSYREGIDYFKNYEVGNMKKIIAAICVLITTMAGAESDESIKVGRYSYVKNVPPQEQLYPLRVTIKTRIPQGIKSVEGAIKYLLMRSGYTLLEKKHMSEEAKTLMELELPQIHRSLGPMTLDVALRALSGSAYELVVDPVHRKVTYELTSRIEKVMQ